MLRMEDICKDKVSLGNFTILFHKKKYLTVALKKVDCGFESGFGLWGRSFINGELCLFALRGTRAGRMEGIRAKALRAVEILFFVQHEAMSGFMGQAAPISNSMLKRSECCAAWAQHAAGILHSSWPSIGLSDHTPRQEGDVLGALSIPEWGQHSSAGPGTSALLSLLCCHSVTTAWPLVPLVWC